MKKYLSFLAVLLVTSIVVFADDNNFINALKNCSSYTESGNVSTEGINVQSMKQILGWQSDKCVYKESVSFSGVNSTVLCNFSKPQIKEITSVMEAYSLVQQYSNQKVDTSSISAVQDNPVVKVWGKYLQDSSVCSINGIK